MAGEILPDQSEIKMKNGDFVIVGNEKFFIHCLDDQKIRKLNLNNNDLKSFLKKDLIENAPKSFLNFEEHGWKGDYCLWLLEK
jgi:hypothetical protein